MSGSDTRSWSRRAVLSRLGALGTLGAVGTLGVPRLLRRNAGAGSLAACPDLAGKRIRWLVGWTPGGGYDAYSRMLEPSLERKLAAEVIIENIPGSAGVVAARQLIRARPDGQTLAIVNGTGLLIAPWSNPEYAPDLHTDFTVLGRIDRHRQIMVTAPDSDIRSPDGLVRIGRERPVVVGETGPSTINFLLAAITEDLFGVPIEIVLGFPGSTEVLTALSRGDVDAAVVGEESARRFTELTPVLRFGEAPADQDPWIGRAAALGGPGGLAAQRPDLFHMAPDRLRGDVDALTALMEVGRLVVAPAGMDESLEACLGQAVLGALQEDEFVAAAARGNRSSAPASADEVRSHLERSKALLPRFRSTVERAARRVRG